MKLALCQMRMSADEQTNLERGLDAQIGRAHV